MQSPRDIWQNSFKQNSERRKSELCKAAHQLTGWYKRWCGELQEDIVLHRKQWEYVYILQSLWERDCIGEGRKGLVFAAGSEPLPALLAAHGCSILATDIMPEKGIEKGWDNANQLCFGVEQLNKRGLCGAEKFERLVSYQPVDMNAIPASLTGYDFNWSSCSFEHLGSIRQGLDFLVNQLDTLKPGGWAVHTTEYNITSNDETQDNNDTVIFRQRDVEAIAARLRSMGHFVEELDYSLGGMPEDFMVDAEPHQQKIHLKLQIGEFVVTSIGLIIQKKK